MMQKVAEKYGGRQALWNARYCGVQIGGISFELLGVGLLLLEHFWVGACNSIGFISILLVE